MAAANAPRLCPIDVPNYFEMNLAPHKAIYVAHEPVCAFDAIPSIWMPASTVTNVWTACGALEAIDFSQQDKTVDLGGYWARSS